MAAACWFGLAGSLSRGEFVESAQGGGWTRVVTSHATDRWWWLAIPPLVALGAIAIATVVRGSKRTGFATLMATTAVLILLQLHTAWNLSYRNPDVPTDMMIYTQTSPDVTRVMSELSQLSYELTGGQQIDVWYDNGVSWPFQWYLRDFTNKRFIGGSMASAPVDTPIIIVSSDNASRFDQYLSGYTATEYVLRWWFPEEIYREFAIAPEIPPGRSAWRSENDPHGIADIPGSIATTIEHQLSPDGQAKLYRLLMYRNLELPIGQFRFKVYVRNDLIPLLNDIRY